MESISLDLCLPTILMLIVIISTILILIWVNRRLKTVGQADTAVEPSFLLPILVRVSAQLGMTEVLFWFWDVASIAEVICQDERKNGKGAFSCIRACGNPTFIIGRSDVAEEILNGKKRNNYTTRFGSEYGLQAIGMYDSGIIWNTVHNKWEQLRRYFQTALKSRTLNSAQDITKEAVEYALKGHINVRINTQQFFRSITMNVTLKLLFGLPFRKDEELIQAVTDYFAAWQFFLLKPKLLCCMFYPCKTKPYKSKIKELQRRVKLLIEERRKLGKANDFLWSLIQAEQAQEISENDLLQCTLEMLIAGTDTSSISILYTFLECHKHPREQEKLLQSLRTENDDSALKAVISESMRVRPVGPIIMRKAIEDDCIEGTCIPKGSNIIINVFRCHHDSNWEHPFEFRPERFQKQTPHFHPFGAGPKGCVGQYLADVEMRTIIKTILPKFEFLPEAYNMATQWDIANQPVTTIYGRFVPRVHICLVGPSGVGKTTLANDLQKRLVPGFNIPILREVGRRIFKNRGLTGEAITDDPELAKDVQKDIWQHQIKEEEATCMSFTILDRTAIDPIVYAKQYGHIDHHQFIQYASEQSSELMELWKSTLERYKNSSKCVFFLLRPIDAKITLKDDGMRSVPDEKDWLQQGADYAALLKDLGIPFTDITTLCHTERLKIVQEKIWG